MNNKHVVLKPNVVIEPLVARWHAWPYLISPSTLGLYVANRHLALLESFVSAPDIHASACQNPALRGGPFVDLPASAIPQVKDLIASTKQGQAAQIAFASSWRDAYRSLIEKADGFSIESFYSSLPEALRGYVELIYSLSGAPETRPLEPLLYRSALHDRSVQSAMIYQSQGDDRSFAFSTPRLPRTDAFELNKAFDDHVYDILSSLRSTPLPISQVYAALGLGPEGSELMDSFLEEVLPGNQSSYKKPEKTRWRYFGHACVLVETAGGKSVLIDPIIAYSAGKPGDVERFTFADLPDHIDYVLLTHNHADHVLLETLLALKSKIGTIVVPKSGGSLVDPSLKLMFQSLRFGDVKELDYLDEVSTGDLTIVALPFLGEHGDLDIRTKAAWLVSAGGEKLLFAADSNNLEPRLYDLIRQYYGQVNTLFLGMECLGAPVSWTYGPLLPMPLDRKKDQSRRLNGSDCDRGLRVIESLGCQDVYIYAMGAEPWLQFITSIDPSETTVPAVNAQKLVRICQERGIRANRLFGRAEASF